MMPLAYDLLALDLDGTLLDSAHRVPPRNRDALHRAHDAGMRIVLCTGRSFFETAPVIEQIGLDLDAAVTVFGAVLNDARSGSTWERSLVPIDTAVESTRWFLDRGYPVLWLNDRQEVGHDGYFFDGPRVHPAYDRWLSTSGAIVSRTDAPHLRLDPPVRISIIDEPASLDAVSADLRRAFDGRLRHNVLAAPTYRLTVIEAFAPHVNKWFGIERICRRWDIDTRRTVAVGDDVNDIDMLRCAGLGVAMGNAPPIVRDAASRSTAPNDDCGVALLIDELLASRA